MWGGKAEKEMRGGGDTGRGKGCRSFSGVCLTALCGRPGERREAEMEGSGETDAGEKRESLKHCLYAGEFWTTLLTSKCFQQLG